MSKRIEEHDGHFYKYEKVLGTGSHGTTWKALDITNNRTVAIKIFGNKKINSSERSLVIEDWEWERKMMMALLAQCEPHAVCVIDAYIENGLPRLVMDFVNGKSVNALIFDNAPKDRPNGFKLLKDLVQGINIIHSKGLVHEDIKAENIIYDNDLDLYRYIDFGLACLQGSKQSAYDPVTGMVDLAKVGFPCSTYGTKYISSPVLHKLTARKRKPIVPWSLLEAHDYWSIGVEVLRWFTLEINKSYYLSEYKKWSGKKPVETFVENAHLRGFFPLYYLLNPSFIEYQICKIGDSSLEEKKAKAVLFLLLDFDDYTRATNFPLVLDIVNGKHDHLFGPPV